MSNMTVEEKAERYFNRFTNLEYEWSCEPTNERLHDLAKKAYRIYVGFCAKNGLEWKKVKI